MSTRTPTVTIAAALLEIGKNIPDPEGLFNATLFEASNRLKELSLLEKRKQTKAERNAILEGMAIACGMDPKKVTKGEWSRIAKAVSDIATVEPDLSAQKLDEAVMRYWLVMPASSILTPTALSNNWSKIWGKISEEAKDRRIQELYRSMESNSCNPRSKRYQPNGALHDDRVLWGKYLIDVERIRSL